MPKAMCVALVAAIVFAGCTKVDSPQAVSSGSSGGSEAVASGNGFTHHGTFTYGEYVDMKTLNPMLSANTATGDLSAFIFSYAVRYDDKSRPVPDALREIPTAKNGDVSADGLTLLYKLRPNVTFHDGVKMTCADLAFTWKAVMNPANNDITHDGYRDIASIDCHDPLVAVVHMKRVYAPFLQQLWGVNGNAPILPAHLLAKYNDAKGSFNTAPFQSAPIGSGPFKFVRWDRSQQVVMDAYDAYFLGKPKLRRVIFKIVPAETTLVAQVTTHEVDLAARLGPNTFTEAEHVPGTVALALPTFEFDHIDFNLRRPLFADVRLRRALEMSVDRPGIIHRIARDLGDLSPVPDSPRISPDYDPNVRQVPYDPAGARALLDRIGWKTGQDGIRVKDGRRLAFSYATQTESTTGKAIQAFVQQGWHDIGADVEIKNQPSAQFFDNTANGVLQGGKYDVASFVWTGGADPDDSSIYSGIDIAPVGQNAIGWNDPLANKAMADGLATTDPEKRRAASFAEQVRFAEDVPSIILDFRRDGFVYNSDLRGFSPSPVILAFWNAQNLSI